MSAATANGRFPVRVMVTTAWETVSVQADDATTVAQLKRLGCDYGQGYRLGRPMPPEAFERLLHERTPFVSHETHDTEEN